MESVLQRDALAEEILHPLHALDYVPQRSFGAGHGQQVMQVGVVDAGPADVVGDPAGCTRAINAFSSDRYCMFKGSVLLMESDTPCITMGSALGWRQGAAAGDRRAPCSSRR